MYSTDRFPRFDAAGGHFYERIQDMFRDLGYESKYFEQGDEARFAVRPSKNAPWLDINVAPGPETDFGQSILLPTAAGGAHVVSPEVYVPKQGDPIMFNPAQVLGNYIQAAFNRPALGSKNIRGALFKSFSEPNPYFHTAGGLAHVGPSHKVGAIRDFAERISVQSDTGLYQDEVLGKLYNMRSSATSAESLDEWYFLNKYSPFKDVGGGGPIRLRNVLSIIQQFGPGGPTDATYLGYGADPTKVGKHANVATNFGLRQDAAVLTYNPAGGVQEAKPTLITSLEDQAGYKQANILFPGEKDPRSSLIIPRVAHVPETPYSGAAQTFGNQFEGIYGFGYRSKAPNLDLDIQNFSELPKARFEFGIYERENLQNAGLETLTGLGISQNKAQAIISHREAGGSLRTLSDITSISGVGRTTARKLMDWQASGDNWIKTQELQNAIIRANETATIGLIRYEDRVEPITYRSAGKETYFTETPKLVLPRAISRSEGTAASVGDENIQDLYLGQMEAEGATGFARSYMRSMKRNFPGEVVATGTNKAQLVMGDIFQTGVSAKGDYKTTFGVSPEPEEGYRPTIDINGMNVPVNAVVGNTKSMTGVFGRMFGALPSDKQLQMATELLGQKVVDRTGGYGQQFISLENMTRGFNLANETKLTVPQFTEEMRQRFIKQAQERPEHFMKEYEMGVSQGTWAPFGYFSGVEKEAFTEATRRSIRSANPNISDADLQQRIDEQWQFTQHKDTDFYEVKFRAPVMYGPMMFEPTPEYLTKDPRITQREAASIAFNFPGIADAFNLGVDATTGDPAPHVRGWQTMGDIYRYASSDTKGVRMTESRRTDLSVKQLGRIREIAGEKPNLEELQAAIEEVVPGAKDMLYSEKTGLTMPSPSVIGDVSTTPLGVQEDADAVQNWAREYDRIFFEGMLRGKAPRTKAGRFFGELRRMTESKEGAMYKHTASTYLSDISAGGRYGLQTGLGGQEIMMQRAVLQRIAGLDARTMNQLEVANEGILGLLNRSPTTSVLRGVQGTLIQTPGTLRGRGGMTFPRAPHITESGRIELGNPLMGGMAFHMGLPGASFLGDWDADPAMAIALGRRRDFDALKDLRLNQGFESWQAWSDKLMRQTIGEIGGIPGGQYDILTKTAGDLMSAAADPQKWFNKAGFFTTKDPDVVWNQGVADLQSGIGMGTSYNLERWLKSAATARGFGGRSIAYGASALEELYQRNLDLGEAGSPLEALFNTTVFGEQNLAQGGLEMRYRWGTLLGNLGRQGGSVGKKELLDTLLGETIKSRVSPVGRAFMFARNEPEFERARQLIEAGKSPEEVLPEIYNAEGYDVTESNLGLALFSSATSKLHGLLGKNATQSFSPMQKFLINERSNTLKRLKQKPQLSVPWRGEGIHPAQLADAPEIFETIAAYQTIAPEGGPPTIEQSAALTRLGTDAPLVLSSATRWGGIHAISDLALAKTVADDSSGNTTVDRLRARARAQATGVTAESVNAAMNRVFDSGQGPPEEPPIINTGAGAEDDDGRGNRRGGNRRNAGGGFPFTAEEFGKIVSSAVLEGVQGSRINLQMASRQSPAVRRAIVGRGLIDASNWGFQASMLRSELDETMRGLGINDELFDDRLYKFVSEHPDEARATMRKYQGSDMKNIMRAGRSAATAVSTSEIPQSTTPEQARAVEQLQAANTAGTSMLQDLQIPFMMQDYFNRTSSRRTRFSLEPGTEAFEKFVESTKEATKGIEDFAEKLAEGEVKAEDFPKVIEESLKKSIQARLDAVPQQLLESIDRGQRALEGGLTEEWSKETRLMEQIMKGAQSDQARLEAMSQTGGQKIAGFARRMLGGWGMFYMGHLAKLGMGQFQQGYQESQAFQQAASLQTAGLFGVGETDLFESPEMQYQQAMARQGGNVFGTLRNVTAQGGMQDIFGAGLTGVGMSALGLYLGSNLAQKDLLPGVAEFLQTGRGMGMLGTIGAVGAGVLTQYSYAQNYDQSAIQAAAFGASGRGFAEYWRGVGPTISDMLSGKSGTTFFDRSEYLQGAVQSALAGGIPMNQEKTGVASPSEMAQIAQVASLTEGTALAGLPVEMQNELHLLNLRGKFGYTGTQLANIGFARQAGLPTQELAGITQYLSGVIPSSGGQFQLEQQYSTYSPERLRELMAGGQFAANLPGMQRYIQQLGLVQGSRATETVMDRFSSIAGGANEDIATLAWQNYATAQAMGRRVAFPDLDTYDKENYISPEEMYAEQAMQARKARGNQIFAGAQSLGLAYGDADALANYGERGLREGRLISGVMALDPLQIQKLAMAGAGQEYNLLANMDINPAGELTGLSWGTTSLARGNVKTEVMGQRILGGLANTGAGQAAIAGGMRGLQDWYVAQQMEQQEAQMGIQAQRLALQREYQPQFWAIQDQQTALSRRQQAWNFEYQGKMFDIQGQQFNERMSFQRQQQLQRQQWTMQDWGYQDLTRNMQWGWKQEDFEENIRFMSGRQRKQAERQMERETIMFGLEGDQIETQRERQKRIWQEQEEQYEMTMRHHREVRDIQEENMTKQRKFYEEGQELQDKMTKLQREYWEKNMQLSEAALGIQQDQLEKSREYQEVMKELNRAQEDFYGQWKLAQMAADETVTTLLEGLAKLLGLDPSILDNAAYTNTQNFSSSWTTSSYIPVTSGQNGGATNINVAIGDEHLASFVIASLENNLKVAV